MLLKLYNRFFICPGVGHVLGTMKAEYYGGPKADCCIRCGVCVTPKKWRR